MRRAALLFLYLLNLLYFLSACHKPSQSKITIGSKFFTEQVILAELLAQHIEAKTGIHVERKTNLGGTLLVHKALEADQLDLYVEYTGTALTAVLNESPQGDSNAVYHRVKQLYSERFHFEVTEPLGFENTFSMVIRGADAKNLHLQKISDIAPLAPKWRAGVGYEFLERRSALADLADKLTASDIRRLNYAVDAQHQDATAVVRAFRAARSL